MPQKFTIPKEDDTQFIIPEDDEQVNEEPPKLNLQPKEGSIARAWRAANTPLVDVSPQTRQMMEEYKKAHPIAGTIGNFGVDAMLSASSPLGLGLEATTGGSALALKYGSPGLARALLAPHIAVSGATTAHGLYRTGKGLYESNYPEAAVGAIETGLGGLGLRGGLRIKGSLNGLDAETVQKPTSFAGRRARPGAAPELSPLAELEPPAPTIKPIESEVPTSEVKPAKIRHPKGKRANQPAKLLMKSGEVVSSQEPIIEPPKSDVHQQIVNEYKAAHEPAPTTEELPPLDIRGETGAVGRGVKQKRIVKDVTFEKGDTDQDYNVKFSDGTIHPIWYSKATREWHLLEDGEPNLDISSPTKEGLASKLAPVSSVPSETQAPKEQPTIEPPLLRSKDYRPQPKKPPPTDMFERGELEPPAQPTHQDFIQNMKDILAQRAKKLGSEETGALTFGGPKPQNKQLRDAVEEWGYGRNVNRIILTKAGQTANNAIRDQKLLNVLAANNIKVGKRGVYSPTVWADIARHDAQAGKMIANYFSKSPEWMQKGRELFGLTKNINLAQGVPGRTGTLSAHGINLGRSDVLAQGFGEGISNFVKNTATPQRAVQKIQDFKPFLKEAIEAGLDWHGEEYSIGDLEKTLRDVPVIGKARELQSKLLEDPLFKIQNPAMQADIYLNKLKELAPKIGRKEAAKAAAEYANDFSGYINKTFRNKSVEDALQMGLLAPSWFRTRINIARKGILPVGYGGRTGYGKPVLRGAAIGAGIGAADMASTGALKYLAGKPAEVTGIPAGQAEFEDDKGRTQFKQRNIEPMGTAIEPTNAAMQTITQMGQGNLSFPFRYLGNRISQPIQAGVNLWKNTDPFGNPLTGKDKYGHPIPALKGGFNMLREGTRPITPGVIAALMDYYQGKAPLEETAARALGMPITYTSIPKGKKASTRLPRLK